MDATKPPTSSGSFNKEDIPMQPTAKSLTDVKHVGKGMDVITTRSGSVPTESPDLNKDHDGHIKEIPDVEDDRWIDEWDVTIHHCQLCRHPFATNEKLNLHVLTWHSDGSQVIPPYTGCHSADAAEAEPQKVIIAEGGDLYLKVGRLEDEFVVYQVASQTLWVASRVFRKMFGPDSPFSERTLVKRAGITGFPPAKLTLDSDPVAFGHTLNVLHHRLHRVPRDVDFPVLVAIAAIVDKYELRDAMMLWTQKWLQDWTSLKKAGFEDWLFVSWVFRMDQQFIEISRELGWRAIRMPNGNLVFGDEDVKRQLCEQTPSSILRGLAEIRESRVEKMRKEFETLYTERQPTARIFCKHPTKFRECDAMQYGHLIAIRNKFGLRAWNNSVREISANLSSIVNLQIPDHDPTNQSCAAYRYNNSCTCPSHKSCSWVPGITRVAKESIAMDFHLTLKDFL